MSDILMPALSPTMEQGKLAKWHVRAGDRVQPGQVIAEIETDKATMEVEAVDEGVIDRLLVDEGADGVAVNTPIAILAAPDGAPPVSREPAPAAEAPAPAPPPSAPPPAAASQPPAAPAPAPAPIRLDSASNATPLAQRLAGLKGLALSGVAGSGPQGRIVARDVEGALGLRRAAVEPQPAPLAPSQPARPSLQAQGIPAGSYDMIALDDARRASAERLSDSFRDAPHFPLSVDVEVDALLALRDRLNATLAADGIEASLGDMVIKVAALTLRRAPEANASFTPQGVALHHHADIAVLMGGVAPVIRQAEVKGVGEIARQAKDFAARAQVQTLSPDELEGGTFTVCDLGAFGVRNFTSVLSPPQGAVLSVGASERRPVVKDGALAIATVITVTLTCDHRAIDGAVAANWIKLFKDLAEQPLGLLL